jgi:hypothetical protein
MALLKQQLVRGVTGPNSVFDTVVNFLTSDPSTAGKDWMVHADYRTLQDPKKMDAVILKNTGKSGNENIYIGIWAGFHSQGLEAGLVLKTYYHFDNNIVNDGLGNTFATDFYNTSYGNGNGNSNQRCFMPFKTDESTSEWEMKPPVEVWVFSNKARVILVINTEERYSNGYMGQYVRHLTPLEVPHPLCCLADSFNGGPWSSYLGYATVDWNGGHVWNNDRRNLIFSRHGNFSNATNTTSSRHFACNRFMTPVGWSYDWYMDPTQPSSTSIVTGTHMNYPDDGFEQMLYPIFVYALNASYEDYYLLGELDGVYWAPNQKNTVLSEVGAEDCIIFPDINRTSWYTWMALKDTP